jgi:ATP-dependent Zn protease
MATAAELTGRITVGEESVALAAQLRKLARAATIVAVLTSPALFVFYWRSEGWSLGWSLAATIASVAAFRGLVDVAMRRLIPWPSLFGTGESRLQEEDIVSRRRAWFWTRKYALVWYAFVFLVIIFFIRLLSHHGTWGTAPNTATITGRFLIHKVILNKTVWLQLAILPLFFLINFAILFGPLLMMGLSQMRGYEPGDANWGVRLPDVRGQAEAKEEVRKIVTLWQSGELFEKAGGKRERGLIFHGPPGTGKTMLAKAIATSFNAPFVAMPGSGFAQTFIGMDAVIVRFLARKAKKLARKWGGQCIVFIDEIDAVGMRRQSLQGGQSSLPDVRPTQFYGPWGALNPSGDVIVETQEWRDWLFQQRAPESRSPYPQWMQKLTGTWNQLPGGMFGGGGGQLALNQLLVVMDGMDNPPFARRLFTNKLNTWLDATYVVPTRIGRVPLRLPAPRPRKEQIYFVGATNVPLQNLDPALTRPGRMGRHVWFRTPTKEDRKDIFDLYLGKVAHEPDLDEDGRRDEIARITNGYSPAMIEQACSMALSYAQHDGRVEFRWEDLLQAMSVIESGAAVDVKYVEHESRAIAIHEAGHAATAHVYRPEVESSRLSIKMRSSGSLGHHQSFAREERFTSWNRELFADLIHGLGAMAAEYVFYGENSNGVGGDLAGVTSEAAWMVGNWGMAPPPLHIHKVGKETVEQTRKRVRRQLERVGHQLLNRTRGSADVHQDPIASILQDGTKRAIVSQTVGMAFVTAYNFIRVNKDKVEAVANELVEKREIYGDAITELLDAQKFVKPEIDWTKDETWPPEMEWHVEEEPARVEETGRVR